MGFELWPPWCHPPTSCQFSPETAASPGGAFLSLWRRAIALVKIYPESEGSVLGVDWETRVIKTAQVLEVDHRHFLEWTTSLKDIWVDVHNALASKFDSSLFLNCALVTRRGWNLFGRGHLSRRRNWDSLPDVEVLRMMQSTGGSAAVEAPLANERGSVFPPHWRCQCFCRLKFGLRVKLRHQ